MHSPKNKVKAVFLYLEYYEGTSRLVTTLAQARFCLVSSRIHSNKTKKYFSSSLFIYFFISNKFKSYFQSKIKFFYFFRNNCSSPTVLWLVEVPSTGRVQFFHFSCCHLKDLWKSKKRIIVKCIQDRNMVLALDPRH